MRLTAELKVAFRAARDQAGVRTNEFVRLAIEGQLPKIAEELLALGLGNAKSGDRPVKFDIDEVCLADLNDAAGETGVPALVLFRLALARASAMAERPRRRKAKK
jgi:hypothetical protein